MVFDSQLKKRSFYLTAALAAVLGLYSNGLAAQGDCGQPISDGAGPVSTDCLFILNAAVGVTTCTPECICDLNGQPPVTSTDALICLNVAVGNPPPDFPNCSCDSTTTTSSSSTTSSTSSTSTTLGGPQACGDTDAPECNGTCGVNEACIPGGSGCICEDLGCGGYMGAALCFGLCPTGSQCVIDGEGCQCVPSATGCNTADTPQCNGDCPEDSFCALDEASGQCLCIAAGCGDFGPAPSCLGVCPPGSTCEDVDANCRCVSGSQ